MTQDEDTLPETGVARTWRHGHCYPMALALTRALGWPAATLSVTLRNGRGHIVHAWVRSPDGRGFDAGGFFDEPELVAEFLDTPRPFTAPRVETHADEDAFLGVLRRDFGNEAQWPGIVADYLEPFRRRAEAVIEGILEPIALGARPTP